MSIVTSKVDGKNITLYFNGRVDTSNAAEVETLVFEALNGDFENVTLDADALEYISSAGLRVVLKIRKQNPTLKIINASPDVYDIFEMTGFSEMIPVEKAFRKLSVDGCTVIGKGAKGSVYRYNEDTIIKVYISNDCLDTIKRERELARKAFVLGIPTAISYDIVKVGENYGSVFELLNAKSYSQLMSEEPENVEKYAANYADLLKTIHGTQVKAEDMPDVKDLIYKWTAAVEQFVTPEQYAKIKGLVDNTPNTLNMIHGDYHTNNVMMQNGETLLIDMDTLSHGHPIFELANVYFTYVGFLEIDQSNVESFLGITAEQSQKVWDVFIKRYLDTDDAARIQDVTQKARLLSDIRIIRHTFRRQGKTDESMAVINKCTNDITKLLSNIDTLEF
ncbi:MAG: anti-sigma factor antagonist [Oscillospiraceae bacterium]|nr:anti-sigma factor antagonist [Candidatus Equicaccousia limihippi]